MNVLGIVAPNQFGTTTITTRLIEERYPNYESVIPSDNTKELRLTTADFLSSIRRASLYANSATHQVRLSLAKNSLVVSAEDADFGSEDRAFDDAAAAWLAPLIDALMAPGGIVASDRPLHAPRWSALPGLPGCAWPYHLMRVGPAS